MHRLDDNLDRCIAYVSLQFPALLSQLLLQAAFLAPWDTNQSVYLSGSVFRKPRRTSRQMIWEKVRHVRVLLGNNGHVSISSTFTCCWGKKKKKRSSPCFTYSCVIVSPTLACLFSSRRQGHVPSLLLIRAVSLACFRGRNVVHKMGLR